VPYDDDLRADCFAVADRIRTDTLVAAAAGRPLGPPPPPPHDRGPRPTDVTLPPIHAPLL